MHRLRKRSERRHWALDLRVSLLVLFSLAWVAHVVAAITRQPPAAGLVATAELGVPAAVVTLGTDEGVLSGAQGAAIIVAAIASLAVATLGTARLATRSSDPATPVVTPV